MKWAVEIQNTSLERRNLSDLLQGLGYQVVDGIDFPFAFTTPLFDQMTAHKQVWPEAQKLRDAMTGPAEIDPVFTLGAVIDYSSSPPKRHHYLEVQSAQIKMTVDTVTLTVSPPKELSETELAEWEATRAEQEYQAKLETQRAKLEPAFREPRAVKMLELLNRDEHTGETLYKIYELAEGHPSTRKAFQAQFGVSAVEFKRFSDAVHNPVVSGKLARHAYEQPPNTPNPMTMREAEQFVRQIAEKWLTFVR